MEKHNRVLYLVVLLFGILLVTLGITYYLYSNYYNVGFGSVKEYLLTDVSVTNIPENTLYITKQRRDYQRGSMRIIIPSIDVDILVGESTTQEGLRDMVGIYEFSQMPGEEGNVSIAGHRNKQEFYYIDKLKEDDNIYLLYDGKVYVYRYKDTKIVKPTDWSVIKPQGFDCITLTTCDPPLSAINRMIVRGELIDTKLEDDYINFK